MNDVVSKVGSPCVDNCCLNEEDICLGCFRSLEEILNWHAATDPQRQTVIATAQRRKEKHRHKYNFDGDFYSE